MALSTFDTFKHIENKGLVELEGEALKELQDVLIKMLEDVDRLCRKYDIEYMLGGGSCLGAVRHKGFIPWDDDLDINMTRSSYEQFCNLVYPELSEKYWLHDCYRTPSYDLAFPRLRLKGTVVRGRDDLESQECGAYIDIFLIENAPSSSALRWLHGMGSLALGFAYSCRRFYERSEQYLGLLSDDAAVSKTFRRKIQIGKVLSFVSVGEWTRIWDRWNSLVSNASSKYVTIPVGRKHYFGELQIRSTFFPVRTGKFHDLSAPLPASCGEYLKSLYGESYMIPPSVFEREKHVLYEFDLGSYGSSNGSINVKA